MRSIGIDIGTSSIKVVEVSMTKRGPAVTQFTQQLIGRSAGFDSEIEIIDFIRNLAESMDFSSARVITSLRQDRVSVRNKIFPFTDRLKILKSLPFELEEELPFPTENAIFEAKMVAIRGSTAEVLACSTPKHRIEEALQRSQSSLMDITLLSVEGIALANCWENWNDPIPQKNFLGDGPAPEQAVRQIQLILHIGHSRTLVLAMEDKSLIGVRSVLWGNQRVVDAVAKRYELPTLEAQKEVETKGFILTTKENASYDQIVFSDTISNEVKELSREVKLTILEFQTELGAQIFSAGITGGGSQILNLHAFLTQQLDIPVNVKKSLAQLNDIRIEISASEDANMGIALGLALEGLKKPRNPAVNFLRQEFAKKNTRLIEFWDRWRSPIQLGALAFIVFFVYASFRANLATSLSETSSESLKTQARSTVKLPSRQANESGVRRYIKDQSKRAQELEELQKLSQMNSALDILKRINDSVPSKNLVGLNLKKVNVNYDRVELEGSVAQPHEVNLLRQSLANIAIDGKVEVLKSSPVTGPGIPFSYSFRVDRGVRTN